MLFPDALSLEAIDIRIVMRGGATHNPAILAARSKNDATTETKQIMKIIFK